MNNKVNTKELISIVVPTYKEAENVPVLSEKIDAAMKNAGLAYEIIVVDDDSNDGIIEAVDAIKGKFNVKLKVRKDEKGLSSAVIAGFELTTGSIIVVMDADLSHPPEKIPELIDQVVNNGAEFVIGSRFVKGGSMPHFNAYRKLNAWVSKMFARPFTKTTDPMAGFFCFPKRILNGAGELNPLGFKIGLELAVKASPKKITEIPIVFQERLHGESKLSMKEQLYYLVHIKRLFEYKYKTLAEFIKFSLVGGTGMLVDLTLVYLAKDKIGLSFRIARVIGFLFALTTNFLLNRKFTFEKAEEGNVYKQYISFFGVSALGFAVNWFLSVYLNENTLFFEEHYLFAAFFGILGGLVVNFSGSKLFVFKHNNSDKK
ncbi:MAG: glycosyltransferase family 2 protein [bacterium]|nr:glycosyltransferase family 2 protein [bacterium]